MRLVAGLGNPGPKYAGNRHNVGFMLVERLREVHRLPAYREKFKGRFSRGAVGAQEIVVLEPHTYMNLSGDSVQAAMTFFKIPLSNVIVVHDELDLPFGTLRLKWGGGFAGHNGLKSIGGKCGGSEFARLRVGIGRPQSGPVERHVLSDFSSEESAELGDVLHTATAALEDVLEHGITAAMNRHNR